MAVKKKYLYTFPAYPTAIDPEMAYSEVLMVKREGLGYKEVTGTPVGRQVKYDYTNGQFDFDPVIYDGTVPPGRYIPDRILIIYKQ